mgnify:CR=1 FL=1
MRKCGYCREMGHVASKCHVKNREIETLRRHVGEERKRILEILIANGAGVGAIVAGHHYNVEGEVPCFVTQEALNSAISLWTNSLFTMNNMKYCKRVRVDLNTFSGVLEPDIDNFRFMHQYNIALDAIPLDTSLDACRVHLPITVLRKGTEGNKYHNAMPTYTWQRHGSILSPSYEGEIDMKAVGMAFTVSNRLVDKSILRPLV